MSPIIVRNLLIVATPYGVAKTQCVTACYNVLQCVAPKWPSRRHPMGLRHPVLTYRYASCARCIFSAHCNALQHTVTHCNTLQCIITRCDTLQHTTTHCNTLQHSATHCTTLQHTAAHCNTLQHIATHCNTLQHTAWHCNTLQHRRDMTPSQQHSS